MLRNTYTGPIDVMLCAVPKVSVTRLRNQARLAATKGGVADNYCAFKAGAPFMRLRFESQHVRTDRKVNVNAASSWLTQAYTRIHYTTTV